MERTSNWYDTKEGIENSLDTLEHFHELLNARKDAYSINKERLHSFHLLGGKYMIDDSAQCMIVTGLEKIIFLPVATKEEANLIIDNWDIGRGAFTQKERQKNHEKALASGKLYPTDWLAEGWWPPSLGKVCIHCGEGWNMLNLQDFFRIESLWKCFSAEDFVGRSLESMWQSYKNKIDAEYASPTSHRLFNDKYIDTTPDSKKSGLAINANGFYPDDYGKTDPKYIIQPGDKINLFVARLIHEHCKNNYLKNISKDI